MTPPKPIIIAIDGPAAAGKTTIARALAARLGFVHIDTGAMYRAVALWALRAGVSCDDTLRLEVLAREASIEFGPAGTVLLNQQDVTSEIRTPEVTDAASRVSRIPAVRRALREHQRRIAQTQSVVMEGRDVGTVVFPDAQIKVFLDADLGIRAGRRAAEIGGHAEALASEIAQRDDRDRTRAEAPMVQAPDAEYIDTTLLTPLEVEEAILQLVRGRTSNGKEHRTTH